MSGSRASLLTIISLLSSSKAVGNPTTIDAGSAASTTASLTADVVADRPFWIQQAYDWGNGVEGFPATNSHRRRLQAMDECQMDAMTNEAAVPEFQCECQTTEAGVRLVCIPNCAYCNDEQTSCGIRSAQALYNVNGTRSALGGVIQYTTGCNAGDVLSVEQTGCDSPGGCNGCAVFANDEQCNSCILRTCPGSGELRELIDCENIEEGATFDLCDPVQVMTGIFEAFNSTEYEVCLDPELLMLPQQSADTKQSKSSGGKGGGSSNGLDCPTSKTSKSSSSSKSSKSRSSTVTSAPTLSVLPTTAPQTAATSAPIGAPTKTSKSSSSSFDYEYKKAKGRNRARARARNRR